MIHKFVKNRERVKVPTTIQTISMDLAKWRQLGIPRSFAEKQLRLIDYVKKLGAPLSAHVRHTSLEIYPQALSHSLVRVLGHTVCKLGPCAKTNANLD